ncbi:MAG: DUF1211 domain-containing protein [Methanomicrobiales archaeon]|nr:DUF1211 domain-containing protein [Methanomicrobiales archaeon]
MEPISKLNLERITNGIYAFTMTLLVRNIAFPEQTAVMSDAAIDMYIMTTVISVFNFIGAFIILGMFWLFYFQMFHRIRSVDFHFVHLHLLSLMIVVFVPFTQSFTDDEFGLSILEVLFHFNYFALATLLIVQWHYAANNPALIEPGMTWPEVDFLQKKFLVPLVVSLLGIVLVLSGMQYIDFLYLLPFVILGIFFRKPPERTVTEAGGADPARDDGDETDPAPVQEEIPEENA